MKSSMKEIAKQGLPRAALVAGCLLLAACAVNPTPYQPLGEEGGFEETRLQERIFRVSFRGNRYTAETDVIDFLFLRSAELTRQNGFSHFAVQQDFGRTQVDLVGTGPRTSVGLGFGMSSRHSFWGMGFGTGMAPQYEGAISYHLAMFVIRLLKPEEAAQAGGQTFEAEYLIRSLTPKKDQSLQRSS
jgi:hypothetical protein